MPQKISDYYKQAIEECEKVSADPETDESTRKEANIKVALFRKKIQEVALDDIVSRESNLRELTAQLQDVMKKAGHSGAGEQITGIKNLMGVVSTSIVSLREIGKNES